MEATIQKHELTPVVDTAWYRLRCLVRLHAYSRWQIAHLIYKSGAKRPVHYRECTTCGWGQMRPF